MVILFKHVLSELDIVTLGSVEMELIQNQKSNHFLCVTTEVIRKMSISQTILDYNEINVYYGK